MKIRILKPVRNFTVDQVVTMSDEPAKRLIANKFAEEAEASAADETGEAKSRKRAKANDS